jgi:ATP phosphoribosyltransferase
MMTFVASRTSLPPEGARAAFDRHHAMITLALSKGRIFDETLPLLKAAGIEVLEDPETSRKLILANQPARRAGACWCAPPMCPPTCSTAAPTWASPGKDTLLEHGSLGLYQPLDLQHRQMPHERGGSSGL